MTADSRDSAQAIARETFGLDGDLTPLAGEFDLNFLIDGGDTRHVLKLSPTARRSVLDMSTRCLGHIADRPLPAALPRPIPALVPPAGGATLYVTPVVVGGKAYVAAALTYVPGTPITGLRHKPGPLLEDLGFFLAQLDSALVDFEHDALDRRLPWKLDRGLETVAEHLCFVRAEGRDLVSSVAERIGVWLDPVGHQLPTGVIHNDANDYNVLVAGAPPDAALSGLIDFGDLVRGWRVAEPAVAAAYLMMGLADPLEAACHVAAGYTKHTPLAEPECAAFLSLVALRLCLSVSIQGRQIRDQPENEYLTVSQEPAWQLLSVLHELDWHVAECRIREASGWAPSGSSAMVLAWVRENPSQLSPVVDAAALTRPTLVDLGVESLLLPRPEDLRDGPTFDTWVAAQIAEAKGTVGVGRYGEARLVYADPAFLETANPVDEQRTLHLGLDLFLPVGTPVLAAAAGTVVAVVDNAGSLNYGPTVLIRHRPKNGPEFYSLYGHLSQETLRHARTGSPVEAGERVGWVGDRTVNGGWPPHLHIQLIAPNPNAPEQIVAQLSNCPGVARPGLFSVWESICPNPAGFSGLPEGPYSPTATLPDRTPKLLERRRRHVGPALSLSYGRPLHIVRGQGTSLYDAEGRAYLDTVNNVAHVGHANARVADAIARQARVLNTNTRYLHDGLVALGDELLDHFPEALDVVYFVCSGSEANELALRMARMHTGRPGVVVVDGGYHGNTGGLVDISPYKFNGPGGKGRPRHVAVAKAPDPYRGGNTPGGYGADITRCLDQLSGDGVAAFICESILSCGGQLEPPPGYLANAYAAVRERGGVCIADEVQVGFGRVGDAFWGFELQDVVPDIVTLGKPMGNGHPIGAVVTTRAVADSFANGMEYFNTFGGNPVSCAAARAVLAEVVEHDLQAHARAVGEGLIRQLRELGSLYPCIGDVRGRGLFLGVDLVRDQATKEPAEPIAAYVAERMRDRRVLTSADGPHHNVLKIKPPLVLTADEGERFAAALGETLAELH